MKTKIYDLTGKQGKEIDLPKCFNSGVREDLISKYIETKKIQQPYAPNPLAGKKHSAKGVLIHQRKVWKSQYGRGMSRIPRKIFMRRGSQFRWEGAFSPNTRGGMRAHPPKILQFLKKLKINKKEAKIALQSALSASANPKYVSEKYSSLDKKELKQLPIVIDSKITETKTKEILDLLKKILGDEIFNIAIKKKKIRSGKGKLRGRKYKSSAGMLFVIGDSEKLKTTAFEIVPVKKLSVVNLARGGPGRLVVYTENAIQDLNKKFAEDKK
ncbi:50S ribosomal protein L4 [Candidatus Pacearchaeota archaeon]|nr:50S ribosomal protein L4 [Candidatus Pacearchaeota archaeon]